MPNHGNVIVKASYCKPNASTGRSAEFHARYIGTRPGTDMTRTETDIQRDTEIEQLCKLGVDGEVYAQYIGRRPGVAMSEDVNHGLFERHGTANMTDVTNELRGLQKTQVMKLIVSLKEDDAAALSIVTKEQWQTLIRKTMPQIGKALDIAPSRLGWVAAFHPEKGHPHCHIIVWDKSDKSRHGNITAITGKELINIKRAIAREIFAEERPLLYEVKNTERDNIRSMAREDVALVLTGISSASLAQPIKDNEKWLQNSLLRIRDKLQGTGRQAYQFMPDEVKKEIDETVEKLINTSRFAQNVKAYVDAHEALARNYAQNTERLDKARENAVKELKERVNNIVLKGAVDFKNAIAADELARNSTVVMEMKLPENNSYVRDCVIRSKVKAGSVPENVIREVVEQISSSGLRETAKEKALEIVDNALKIDFNYKDWEAVKEQLLIKEKIEEQRTGFGIQENNVITGVLHSMSSALCTAHQDKQHELELAQTKQNGAFTGRTIIKKTMDHVRQNALYREQDLER